MKVNNYPLRKLLALVIFPFSIFTPFQTLAQDAGEAAEESGTFSPNEMIMHHILDDYGWHLWDYTDDQGVEHPVSIPLPVILYTYQGDFLQFQNVHLDVFMSSAFHHGTVDVEKGDRIYSLDHGHIEAAGGYKIVDFSITKNVASMMLSVILLFVVFFSVVGAYKKREGKEPKGLQSFIEPIIVFLRDDVIIPNIGADKYHKYFPYLLSLFFFIWFNNLLGLIPTGANASGNIAFTLTLAVFTMLVTNFSANRHYWKHIFWTPGVPLPLRVIMLPVEVIGIFTKPFALMVRLFANITAGHIIILSLIRIIFIFKNAALGVVIIPATVALTFLELFVAILQAYIFTLLSALFIGMAVNGDDHH